MLFTNDVTPAQRQAAYAQHAAGAWTPPPRADLTEQVAATPDISAEGQSIPLSFFTYGPRIRHDGEGNATLHIAGPMDGFWGYNSLKMSEVMDAIDAKTPLKSVLIDLATPGGRAEEAFRTVLDMQARRERGVTVNTRAAGIVASAGTVVYAMGKRRSAPAGARFMAHAPYLSGSLAFNRASSQRLFADMDKWLSTTEAAMRDIYALAGIPGETLDGWMDGRDHWMTPSEANEAGLANDTPEDDDDAGQEDKPQPNDTGSEETTASDKAASRARLSMYDALAAKPTSKGTEDE